MNALTADRPVERAPWSVGVAVLVTLAPLAAAAILAWSELREPGRTTALSVVAVGLFAVSPTVGSVASARTPSPTVARRSAALIAAIGLLASWIAFVPEPTQPGLNLGGTGPANGMLYAFGIATAWSVAARQAGYWLGRGHLILAVSFSAATVLAGSVVAFALAVTLP